MRIDPGVVIDAEGQIEIYEAWCFQGGYDAVAGND